MIALYSTDVHVDDDCRVRRQGHVFASVYKAKADLLRRPHPPASWPCPCRCSRSASASGPPPSHSAHQSEPL